MGAVFYYLKDQNEMQGSTSSNMNDIQNDSEHSTKIEEMEWSTGSSSNQI